MNSQFIVFFISKTKKSMIRFIEGALSDKNMTDLIPSHGNILTVLYQNKESMTMKAIAEKIGKDKSTLTVLLNYLEEKYDEISKMVVKTA